MIDLLKFNFWRNHVPSAINEIYKRQNNVPSAPSGIAVYTAGSDQLQFVWSAQPSTQEFRLYTGPSSNGPWTLRKTVANAGNTRSSVVSGLTPNSTVYGMVRSYNGITESPNSTIEYDYLPPETNNSTRLSSYDNQWDWSSKAWSINQSAVGKTDGFGLLIGDSVIQQPKPDWIYNDILRSELSSSDLSTLSWANVISPSPNQLFPISGLEHDTTYYVILLDANNFQLSSTSNGSAIDLTALGVGSGHIIGSNSVATQQIFDGSDSNIVDISNDKLMISGHSFSNNQQVRYLCPQDVDSNDLFYLASSVFAGIERCATAVGGLSAGELLVGNGNGGPSMSGITNSQELAKNEILDSTIWGNLHIDTILTAFSGAQYAIVQFNNNSPPVPKSGSGATANYLFDFDDGDVGEICSKLESFNIIPIISIPPPRSFSPELFVDNEFYARRKSLLRFAEQKQYAIIENHSEVMARRPGESWRGTIIAASDAVHYTSNRGVGYNASGSGAVGPYQGGDGDSSLEITGQACKDSGWILSRWLQLQTAKRIKDVIYSPITPQTLITSSDFQYNGIHMLPTSMGQTIGGFTIYNKSGVPHFLAIRNNISNSWVLCDWAVGSPTTHSSGVRQPSSVVTNYGDINSSSEVRGLVNGINYYRVNNVSGDTFQLSESLVSNPIISISSGFGTDHKFRFGSTNYYFDGSDPNIVNASTNRITITGHPFVNGSTVQYNSYPSVGGMYHGSGYYAIPVDSNTIRLATSLVNANSNTYINLTYHGLGAGHGFGTSPPWFDAQTPRVSGGAVGLMDDIDPNYQSTIRLPSHGYSTGTSLGNYGAYRLYHQSEASIRGIHYDEDLDIVWFSAGRYYGGDVAAVRVYPNIGAIKLTGVSNGDYIVYPTWRVSGVDDNTGVAIGGETTKGSIQKSAHLLSLSNNQFDMMFFGSRGSTATYQSDGPGAVFSKSIPLTSPIGSSLSGVLASHYSRGNMQIIPEHTGDTSKSKSNFIRPASNKEIVMIGNKESGIGKHSVTIIDASGGVSPGVTINGSAPQVFADTASRNGYRLYITSDSITPASVGQTRYLKDFVIVSNRFSATVCDKELNDQDWDVLPSSGAICQLHKGSYDNNHALNYDDNVAFFWGTAQGGSSNTVILQPDCTNQNLDPSSGILYEVILGDPIFTSGTQTAFDFSSYNLSTKTVTIDGSWDANPISGITRYKINRKTYSTSLFAPSHIPNELVSGGYFQQADGMNNLHLVASTGNKHGLIWTSTITNGAHWYGFPYNYNDIGPEGETWDNNVDSTIYTGQKLVAAEADAESRGNRFEQHQPYIMIGDPSIYIAQALSGFSSELYPYQIISLADFGDGSTSPIPGPTKGDLICAGDIHFDRSSNKLYIQIKQGYPSGTTPVNVGVEDAIYSFTLL